MKKTITSVLYLGDTSLDTAASYLAGVMTHFNIGFDYAGSDEPADRFLVDEAEYRLIVLSDYPAQNLETSQMEQIIALVCRGTGLLMIGGYNRVGAKAGARVILEAIRYRTRAEASSCLFTEEGRDVLLAVGGYGGGRTAAFTSDAAPHWIGGFVDWGDERVSCKIAGAEVEVGAFYAAFFNNLIRWTAGL